MADHEKSRPVSYYEHGYFPQEGRTVGGISRAWLDRQALARDLRVVDNWLESHLAVMHLGEEEGNSELEGVRRTWTDCYRNAVFIMVRVTSGGRREYETKAHQKWIADYSLRKAYVLHVRNHEALETEADVCGSVLAMTPDVAEQVYSEELCLVPDPIRRAFEAKPSFEVLGALAVLCQGFLAVHAGPDGAPEVDDSGRWIAQALGKMEWDKVCQSDDLKRGLDPRLTATDRSGRDALRQQVAAAPFWNVFEGLRRDGEELSDAVLRAAKLEWGQTADSDNEFSYVRDLIQHLSGPVNDPLLVARAYIALAKRLKSGYGA